VVFNSGPGITMPAVRGLYDKAADFGTIKEWVHNCEHQHGLDCKPGKMGDINNLSVIDCKRLEVVLAPSDCKFVALSYVWGPATLPIPLKSAPATIKDSITATLALGYRYIWIDRYVRVTNWSSLSYYI
jgi:hypothetical protein